MAILFLYGLPVGDEAKVLSFGSASGAEPDCVSFMVPIKVMMGIPTIESRIWYYNKFWKYRTWRSAQINGKVVMRTTPCTDVELHKRLKLAALLQGVELG